MRYGRSPAAASSYRRRTTIKTAITIGSIKNIRELPVNSLPILIIIVDADFTDLHRRCCPNY